MSKELMRQIITLATTQSLARIKPDGGMSAIPRGCFIINAWALCYSIDRPDNPFHKSPELLEAIVRFGNRNLASFDEQRGFTADRSEPAAGWDEWRMIAWLEAMELVKDDLDAKRIDDWTRAFCAFGEHFLAGFYDMDTFDGGIPNHGIWDHVLAYRTGQLFGVKKFLDAAGLGLERIIDSQTPDGCFREFQNAALFQGTPVTGYNLVSSQAINMYYGYSGDPRAAEALEKAWHWYYDYLLPDFTMPPNFDCRQPYNPHRGGGSLPAYFINKPEGRYMSRRALQEALQARQADTDGRPDGHGASWLALQYDKVQQDVDERKPAWPETRRMVAAEAGVRRRNGWTAHLSGITNIGNSNFSLRLFVLERQDHLSLHHDDLDLIVGSSGSMIQQELSTFVFYDTGRAHYLADQAYFKSTPALDTLLLRYGSNVGAASIDTADPGRARIILSLHGERGRRPDPGIGHTQSAMAARAHLSLRLKTGDTITAGDSTWPLTDEDETMLRLSFPAGQEVSFGKWKLVCVDGPWELRWPVRTFDPYRFLAPRERLAVAEVILHQGAGALASDLEHTHERPTATFHVIPGE